MSTASAHQVAAELRRRLPGLGVKKLHKLLYYCQGHHLAAFGVPLFTESVSAWDMGPVVGALWYQEKEHATVPSSASLDEGSLNTVGYVVSRYGKLSGSDLERLTHNEDPWLEADASRGKGESVKIPVEVLEGFFRRNSMDDDDPSNQPDAATIHAWLSGAVYPSEPAKTDSFESISARARSHA